MTIQELVEALALEPIHLGNGDKDITGGYASDLLSCVMAKARPGHIWVTLQAHPNVVAVASLLDLSAVIITEAVVPDQETVARARENGTNLLRSPQGTFAVVGRLSALGIGG